MHARSYNPRLIGHSMRIRTTNSIITIIYLLYIRTYHDSRLTNCYHLMAHTREKWVSNSLSTMKPSSFMPSSRFVFTCTMEAINAPSTPLPSRITPSSKDSAPYSSVVLRDLQLRPPFLVGLAAV